MSVRADIHSLVSYLNEDATCAAIATRAMRAAAVEAWPDLFATHPQWRSLRTFSDLLDDTHEALDVDPKRAWRLSVVLLRETRRWHVPDLALLLHQQARGIAWKEHGNALRALGRLRHAVCAANRAVLLLAPNALIVERTAAQVLRALLTHDLGDSASAAALLRQCSETFRSHAEYHRELQVAVIRAAILHECRDFEGAYDAFVAAYETAAALENERERARILNNAGHCAIELGREREAWTYLARAAAAFAAQGMEAELPRAAWGIARLLRDHGSTTHALQYLDQICGAFRERGMVVEAATALLDVAIILLRQGNVAHAQQLCAEMLTTFGSAGLATHALRALEHLRNESQNIATLQEELPYLRNYFWRLRKHPGAPFAKPGH